MNKLFKTKNFLIIQTTAIALVVFSVIVSIYGVSVSLLNWLERLFGDSFGVCINMGPEPGYYPTLPCFYGNVLVLDMVLMILVIVYFFAFVIYKLRNKITN